MPKAIFSDLFIHVVGASAAFSLPRARAPAKRPFLLKALFRKGLLPQLLSWQAARG